MAFRCTLASKAAVGNVRVFARAQPARAGRRMGMQCQAYNITFKLPNGEEKTVQADDDTYILDAALDQGVDLPYSCREANCTTCTAKLLNGAVDADEIKNIGDDSKSQGYHLICRTLPRDDCTFETHKQDEMKANMEAQLQPQPHTEGY